MNAYVCEEGCPLALPLLLDLSESIRPLLSFSWGIYDLLYPQSISQEQIPSLQTIFQTRIFSQGSADHQSQGNNESGLHIPSQSPIPCLYLALDTLGQLFDLLLYLL